MIRLLAAFVLVSASAGAACAHSAERGFVLLLPTGFIIVGGAAGVAFTFLVLAMLRDETVRKAYASKRRLPGFNGPPRALAVISAGILAFALYKGITGSNDPLRNLLPLTVWVGFWIIIVLLHPLLGNLWRIMNPFSLLPEKPDAPAPRWSGWPALLLFSAFAWIQLVYPAPENPKLLAFVVMFYCAATTTACLLFGSNTWLQHGDPFAILFRLLGRTAPLQWPHLQMPGAGLVKEAGGGLGVTLLIILALSAITFDALAATFTWASLWGVNPLEHPGRTALMTANGFGLFAGFAGLTLCLLGATGLGRYWSGHNASTSHLLIRFTLAMLPISVVFHFSHYFTELLVNGQYLLFAWSSALGLGGEHAYVTTSFLNTASGAWKIYGLQTASIVLGHAIGVAVVHAMVLDEGLNGSRALKLETPLALLMIAYTGFGLWLLSTPTIA